MYKKVRVHYSADVSEEAKIGAGTEIWNNVKVRDKVKIGQNCIIHKGVYIDEGVKVGNNVKIQGSSSIFKGVNIKDGVFIGPHVCFTNDKNPRAINPNGKLKRSGDWIISETKVEVGASIGANTTILPSLRIGKWALVGAGSVVTKNVPNYGLVLGNPAELVGYVNESGKVVKKL